MVPGESLPLHQAQTFMVIFQAARTWGNITSQASTQAGFSIHCFNASVPVPQAHLGTLQEPNTIWALQSNCASWGDQAVHLLPCLTGQAAYILKQSENHGLLA